MKLTETLLKEMIKEEITVGCGNVVDGILGLVKDIDPNDVSDIFTAVFEQLPGVELEMDPDAEAEELPTDYQPGGTWEDRPVVGFEEQLKLMITEALQEAAAIDNPELHEAAAFAQEVQKIFPEALIADSRDPKPFGDDPQFEGYVVVIPIPAGEGLEEDTIKEEASDCVKDYELTGNLDDYCACMAHYGEHPSKCRGY
jgi:hypothetical protein